MKSSINKEENAAKACEHTEKMDKRYSFEIFFARENSKVYSPNSEFNIEPNKYETETLFLNTDTVSALKQVNRAGMSYVGVLNFASYKSPGGLFLDGSMAQEEALCHESYLYNVLRDMPEYYAYNNKHLNRALYTNRALFTPEMKFRNRYWCNVLTCAAPNYRVAHRFNKVSAEENYKVMKNRTDFMLSCFADNKCPCIILGAWGCSVFGQNPAEVAGIMKELLDTKFKGCFEQVVIAVPGKNRNYEEFKKVFSE